MYDPNRAYWIDVNTNSLTSEEKARVREHLDFPHDMANFSYAYFFFQESADVMQIGVGNVDFIEQDNFIAPKEFMHLLKIYSIDKQLALIACVDTMKKQLEEESGGLE